MVSAVSYDYISKLWLLTHFPLDVWVDLWSSSSDNATASRLGYWLGLYGAFSVIQVLALALAVL